MPHDNPVEKSAESLDGEMHGAHLWRTDDGVDEERGQVGTGKE